ncbi:MAG: UDP-glucose 4-epimerase GalE [Bacteroidia bacterium]
MDYSKKILVTGGAGYIGSHTIIELINKGCTNIVSIDNYSNSDAAVFERIRQITGVTVSNEEIDLSDTAGSKRILKKHNDASGIIHFAAYKSVPESVQHPLLYYKNNINSLLNILEFASATQISRIIFSSSCSVYGNISTLPVNEETIPGKTESPYAYTKVIGEKIMEDFCAVNKQILGISLRYFNPVGAHPSGLIGELPKNRPNNLVPVITRTAIGKIPQMEVFGNDYTTRDGTCIRDYIHVLDIARAHVAALFDLKKEENNYNIINLGSGQGVSVLEAIQAFEKVSGVKVNYKISARRAGDVAAIFSDCSKAKKMLNWEAQYSLEDMMHSAWKWEQHLKNTE